MNLKALRSKYVNRLDAALRPHLSDLQTVMAHLAGDCAEADIIRDLNGAIAVPNTASVAAKLGLLWKKRVPIHGTCLGRPILSPAFGLISSAH